MTTAAPGFCPSTLGFSLPPSSLQGPSPEEARALIAAMGVAKVDWSTFGQHLAFDPECYVRRRLFLSDTWEVLLLNWLPGQKTAIHDHGNSLGFTLLLMGDLVETNYRWLGEGRRMEAFKESPLGPHQITTEARDTVHVVSNRSAAPAASLHLYSPPLTFLHAYDSESGKKSYIEPSETRFLTR